MKYSMNTIRILFAFFLFVLTGQVPASAQDSTSLNILSSQKRPAPEFDHDLHIGSLGDTECGKCHHVFDEDKNTLTYSEGEESACTDCHQSEPTNGSLSLKDASHASCTDCHRKTKKEKRASGPTTCGECHKK